MFCVSFLTGGVMRWTLFILFCLLGAPAHAVAIPGVTTGTSTSQQAAPEPSPEQKKGKKRPMRPWLNKKKRPMRPWLTYWRTRLHVTN
ncbi:Potassium efflux system KefA protein / Small-conductance mechanosensitive channel [Salmonella enterica subsp. enterica serovar Gaminara str. A4-567]|nr:Potassium efflux system KefA protein / Small-conductance mechanosensitive channel [Salmonella enterica subsp. enterica serovar Gaminara str. A4-567]